MGVLIGPAVFGFVVGVLPSKAGWFVFILGLVVYFLAFSSMAGSAADGAGWGIFLGIFLALPFLVGWLLGLLGRRVVRASR